jgi:hypothetical protein
MLGSGEVEREGVTLLSIKLSLESIANTNL